jgi:Na+/phosphate symporter
MGLFLCRNIIVWREVAMDNNLFFWVVAGALFILACILVLRKIEISVGHTTLFVLSAALLIFPFLSNFEWSNGTLKFTTKQQTSELADKVKELADTQTKVTEAVSSLANTLERVTNRMATVEETVARKQPELSVPGEIKLAPDFWDEMKQSNNNLILKNQKAIIGIDRFQQDLKKF